MGSPHYLHKLLTGAESLSSLLAASRHHAAVLAEVRARLPDDLAAAVRCAIVEAGCLRLGMCSNAWAARVRYLAPRLVRELSDLSTGAVETIEVFVVVAPDGPGVRPPMPAPLSAASRAHLEAVASTIEDPRLAAALRSLAGS